MSHLLVNDLVFHTAYLSFPRAVRHFRPLQLMYPAGFSQD